MNLNALTAHELSQLLNEKKTTPDDIYRTIRTRIDSVDTRVRAYVRLFDDPECKKITGHSPYAGIPIAIKDNMCIAGQMTTCCSRILEGFRPPYDATVIAKLKAAGAVFIGYTNMDEFAFGSSTENSHYGPTHNPWSLDRVPGGSSGGSAAAVAAREAVWALGSDTGGSIRQPASFCGVVGLKPTYGRVSRYGLIAFASSLDQIGPITKDVTDAAILLGIIAGHDERDSTSVDTPVPDYTQSLVNNLKGITIGVPKEYFVKGIEPDVHAAVRKAIDVLKEQGASIIDVSLPHTEYAVATYYIVATAEASSNLARFDGVQYGLRAVPRDARRTPLLDMYEATRETGFGPEAKRRVILGTYTLSAGYYDAYYIRGQKVRTLIKNDFDAAFKNCDAIVTPTSPTTAFKIGERAADPLSMYLSDAFTIPANLAGVPAISIPCGLSKEQLPIGMQIIAKPFGEEMLFRVAYAFEQNTDWHTRRASL